MVSSSSASGSVRCASAAPSLSPSFSMLPVAGCRKKAVTVLFFSLYPPPAACFSSPSTPSPPSSCGARPAASLLAARSGHAAATALCCPPPAPGPGLLVQPERPRLWASFRFRFFLPPAATWSCVFWCFAIPVADAASIRSSSAGFAFARFVPGPLCLRASAGCPARALPSGAPAWRT